MQITLSDLTRIDGKTLIDDLCSRAIYADCRGPVLRLSPGIVTRADHIDRLFAALDEAERHASDPSDKTTILTLRASLLWRGEDRQRGGQ